MRLAWGAQTVGKTSEKVIEFCLAGNCEVRRKFVIDLRAMPIMSLKKVRSIFPSKSISRSGS